MRPDHGAIRSAPGLALRLARQWWPQVLALAAACGVVATTIAGALCVGRSLQNGLRALALERLGGIEAAVMADEFFTDRLVAALRTGPGGPVIVPAIVMPAVAVRGDGTAARITLLACDEPDALGFDPPPPPLAPGGVLVNAPLAEALGLAAGDPLLLRLPSRSSVPADSPLGRRTGGSASRRLTVSALLPPRGIGQFAVRPVQATPPLAVTSLADARRILRRGDVANAVFAVGNPGGADAATTLRERLAPTLVDYGLGIWPASTEPASLRLTSRGLILPAAVDAAAAQILAPLGGRPTLAFLANSIEPVGAAGDRTAAVPYSTILGIDATTLPVGDLVDDEGRPLVVPEDDGIIVDRWVADDLAAQGRPVAVGDLLRLRFFQPETTQGRVEEASTELRITGIAAMQGAATARGVVPEVEGITDEDSIADWDPPFPFDATRVRTTPPQDQDDRYWKAHGPAPKAFVSLATARRLAAGRFGGTTAWLVPRTGVGDVDSVAEALAAKLAPEALGIRVVPMRAEALAAARGSTPFGGLFLALSSFVIASGLLLAWLLFSLLVAAHGRDLGILAAVGFSPRRLAALLVGVGGLAAVSGVAVGTLLGPAWAAALLAWLGRAWTAGVEAGAARAFQATAPAVGPVAAAAAAALLSSLLALAWAARGAGRLPPLTLLRGGRASGPRRGGTLTAIVAAGGLVAAGVLAAAGRHAGPATAVGLFFSAGFAALAGLLALVRLWLAAPPSTAASRTLTSLALQGLRFAPGRAFSVAAIVAAATFLIVAVSSFAQRPPADPADRSSPTGGWTDIVTFGMPTGVDPSDPEARAGLGLSSARQELIAACEIARLRSSGGDDAACSNLYAVRRPIVVGVGPGFIARGGFRFITHAPTPAGLTPWSLLDRQPASADAEEAAPAILDQATAQWGLGLGGVGSEFTIPDDSGIPARFRIVGLLEPGILQGLVIVAEREFERIFPGRSGYGMALVDASSLPAARRRDAASALVAAWADAAASTTSAAARLGSIQAVQNTFLAGFQALGTLGLLLGTAGVAAVQLQGMLERLGALAVLRAVGFTLARVRWLLAVETVLMVALGLATGTAAALLAVAPALATGAARLPLRWIAITCVVSAAAAVAAAALAVTRTVIPARPRAE